MPLLHAELAARFEDQRFCHPDSVHLGLAQSFLQIRRRDAVTEARAFEDRPILHDDDGAPFEEARQAWRTGGSLGCEPVQEKQDGAGYEGAPEWSAPGQCPAQG